MMDSARHAVWSRSLRILVYIGIWTIPGLITASQLLLSYNLRGDDPDPGLVFRLALPGWYIWGALAPLIFLMARRFPLEGSALFGRSLLHLAANVLVGASWVTLVISLRGAFDLPGATAVRPVVVSSIGTSLLVYWTIVLLAHAAQYRQDREARARRESELAAQLSEARLTALKSQLHPHFLCNTLNAISAFVRSDPARAESMLAELGDLLREVVDAPDQQVVPLSRELEFVDRYLSIQKTRLGERLIIERDIGEGLGDLGVPSMLLQPLVENAVEHGIARRREGGRLTITAARENGNLTLLVADDGPGAPRESLDPSSWRVGLHNTRDRLQQLYGSDARFELENGPTGGVQARVRVPLATVGGDT